jgi:hypothetical protein
MKINIGIIIFFVIIIAVMSCNNNEKYINVFGQYVEAPFEETKYDNMDTLEYSYPYYSSYFYPFQYYPSYYNYLRPPIPYG